MSDKLDLILFGATGFTGKLCVKHLLDNYCNNKDDDNNNTNKFRFGLAARNLTKLQNILNDIDNYSDNQKYFELIECDSFNLKQIESTIKKTNVIITTVGPYCVYGTNLVKICCLNGVDYVDLSGEFHWVKDMINKYQNNAIKSNSRIVNIAGVLASLSDCAIYAAIQKLNTNNDNNDNYKIQSMLEAPVNASESGGSTLSILNMYKQGAFNDYYNKKFAYALCPSDNEYKNVQPRRGIFPQWNSDLKRYECGVVFAGEIERMVFCRSNHLLNYIYGKSPLIDETIILLESKYYIIGLLLGLVYVLLPFILIKLSFLKSILIKLMGLIIPKPGVGPSKKIMEIAEWKHYLLVENIKTKKKIKVSIDIFGDYMYYNTSKLLVEQGLIFAIERKQSKLDKNTKYGFITPAVAFGDKLVQRLNKLKEFDIKFT